MHTLRNSVHLIGKVGSNPRVRGISNGQKLTELLLVTSDSYQNAAGEKRKESHWHCLLASGKLAELIIARISKGCEIAVEGKLCTRNFINSEGIKVCKVEVQLREILILQENNQTANAGLESSQQSSA